MDEGRRMKEEGLYSIYSITGKIILTAVISFVALVALLVAAVAVIYYLNQIV